jgi:hypothetical protein
MIDDTFLVAHRALQHGFEFHLSPQSDPQTSLCGIGVEPTQIPPYFYGVESAIEGRWCPQCERLARQRKTPPPSPASPGDAPCV